MTDAKEATSTRPYLIRALYEWCTDNGLTPYVAVLVDETVRVPNEYVKDGEIVLNISFDATSSLKLGNDFIEFKARFAGTARDIMVPINRVVAIYARENGQGMSFPLSVPPPLNNLQDSRNGSSSPTGPAGLTAVVPSVSRSKSVPSAGDSRPAQLTPVPSDSSSKDTPPPRPPSGPRPALKRVK